MSRALHKMMRVSNLNPDQRQSRKLKSWTSLWKKIRKMNLCFMVNLFLCNWNSTDYGDLCFNDLYEYLYRMENGTYVYSEDYEQKEEPYYHSCIPAELFEGTILPYFDISLDEFRARTLYNSEENTYPWQEVSALNIVYFPALIPEVTGTKENDDGTITLTVNVMCLDEQTDCLFTHKVTIMPMGDEMFQYLSNEITYMGDNPLETIHSPKTSRE